MKISTSITCLALSFSVISLSHAERHGEKTSVLSEEEAKLPAIPLFNGKDLTGWTVKGGNGMFEVKDGTIVGHGTKINDNTFLITDKTYKNFIFTFKFKFHERTGNTGVMFRANQKPLKEGQKEGNGRVFGYQCEGDNKDRNWTGGLYDEARRKWLYPTKTNTVADGYFRDNFTAQGTRLIKWDDWNEVVIRCEGNRIQTWLNGELRVNFVDTHPEYDTREGFFGLQVHKGDKHRSAWKDINIRILPNAPAKAKAAGSKKAK